MSYDRGQFVFHSSESNDGPLVVNNEDLDFNPQKLIPVHIFETHFKLQHLGERYDEWFNKLLKSKCLRIHTDRVFLQVSLSLPLPHRL